MQVVRGALVDDLWHRAFSSLQIGNRRVTLHDHIALHGEPRLALKSTVVKIELQVNDLDRHYYATHGLTIAQHPSETAERVMVRVLAFALNAAERLEFGKGLSTDDEPDLWERDLTGGIERWIEVGQPDEQRIRRACGRAREVRVYPYGGRSAGIWWEKTRAAVERCGNLRVTAIAPESAAALAALHGRGKSLQVLVQDGQVQAIDDDTTIDVALAPWFGASD